MLHHYSPKIIAVTGSVGKTSTKDAIYTIISSKFRARKSQKSFNSEIGLPLTILGLSNAWANPLKWLWNIYLGFWRIFFSRNYPRILVLEVGADKPGDIKNIMSWLKPDIAVVTALADVPVHVENFSSIEAVYEEKGRLLESLSERGVAILNADDKRVMGMREKMRDGTRVITFGMKNESDISGNDLFLPQIPNPYPILAAGAVGKALGMKEDEIKELSKKVETPKGRMNVIKGINGSTIIDDTYNSSPVAAEFALETLRKMDVLGRRIACLGNMAELGEYSESEHKRIGEMAKEVADIVITVGDKARWISGENNFSNSVEAGRFLKEMIKEGDVILAKGSQNNIRMEKLVEEIMLHPEDKQELLVRQDEEWERR